MSTTIQTGSYRDLTPIVMNRNVVFQRVQRLSKKVHRHVNMFGWDDQAKLMWRKLCQLTHRYRDLQSEVDEFFEEQPLGVEALLADGDDNRTPSLDSRLRGGL